MSDLRYKKFLRGLARNMIYSVRWVISRLPDRLFKLFAFVFVAVGRIVINRKRKIALESLNTAFGHEMSPEEISQVAESCFKNYSASMIDLVYFLDRPEKLVEKVSIEGKEVLDQALARGQGAILLSAHFGNFIAMYLRMALAGYKVNCIMRRVRDEDLEAYITNLRNERGLQTIHSLPHRQCISNSLKRLRDNQVLFILLDQHYGDAGGVFVDFFGQQAATATGPVVFSKRSGAPILPIFILRDGTDRYKIKIEEPVQFELDQGGQPEMEQNVSQLTKIIEGYIRRYPSEWGGWIHRRWKNQPSVSQV